MQNGFEVRVGCDVQSAIDVRTAIEDAGDRYLHRVLSAAERDEVALMTGSEAVARYTAGRFAGKEAVYKALRGRPDTALPWPQIEIVSDGDGAPRVRLTGAAADLAAAAGIGEVAVSISHTAQFAFAVATAVAVTD